MSALFAFIVIVLPCALLQHDFILSSQNCVGTSITPRHILTGANCATGGRVWIKTANGNSQEISTANHWVFFNYPTEMGIVELSEPIENPHIVKLDSGTRSEANKNVIPIRAMAVSEDNGINEAGTLTIKQAVIKPKTACRETCYVNELCVRDLQPFIGATSAHIGSPLMSQENPEVQVGVLSYSREFNLDWVFKRVSWQKNWVLNVVPNAMFE